MENFTKHSFTILFVFLSVHLFSQSPTFVEGDYRSTASGVWGSNTATPATWEKLQSGVWVPSNSPDYNTSANIYIQSGNSIETGGSFTNANIYVLNNGSFIVNHASTANTMYVYDDATLQVNAEQSIAPSGLFNVNANGWVELNYPYSNPSNTIWQGQENFSAGSNFIIKDWNTSVLLIPNSSNISLSNDHGFSACFGNLIIDMFASSASAPLHPFANGFTNNLTHGDLIFRTCGINPNSGFCMMNNGNYNTVIGDSLIIESAYINTVCLLDNLGIAELEIKGNLVHNSTGIMHLCVSNQMGTEMTLTVDGDINVTAGDLAFNDITSGSNPTAVTINLKGDLFLDENARLLNSYTASNGIFNFMGEGDGLSPSTIQTIKIASIESDENSRIDFHIKNGAYVQLKDIDLELGTNSAMIVENAGILDFGFNGNTALVLTTASGQTNNFFELQEGGVLKITSPQGINSTGNTGNVQVTEANRSFNQTAYFHYVGKENQMSGNALDSTATGKFVIIELIDNNTTFSLSNNIGISNGNTLDLAGGKLAIRRGIVKGTANAEFVGTGRLEMSSGEYRISTITQYPLTNKLPQLSNYSNYVLSAGTVHLNGDNATQILSSIPNYYNLMFSGTNTLGANYKGIDGQTTVNNQVYITGNAVVDIQSNSLIGDAGLLMESGLLRMSKTDVVLPELGGIATPYSLVGGSIEFYGSSSSQHQIIKGGLDYYTLKLNANASNFDDANIWAESNFTVQQGLTVQSPAVFKLNTDDVVSGDGTFTVEAGSGLFYGNASGINITGPLGNVQVNGTRTFSGDANYGFVGAGDMITGTALPTQVHGLYIKKDNNVDQVRLLNSLKVENTLKMLAGNVTTLIYVLELGISTSQRGNLDYTDGYVIGSMKRWFSGLNAGDASGLFPIGVDGNDRFVKVEYTGTAPLVGGSLTATFIPLPMGPLGFPVNGIATVGSCPQFNANYSSDAGYWQMTDANGLTGGNYDITLVGENMEVLSSLCEITALKRTGIGPWGQSGNHTQTTGSISRPVVRRTSASGWSNWGFGMGTVTPLPVELISFTGNCSGTDVNLRWTTASEVNSARFVVERSSNMQTFEYVTEVQAAGNSNEIINYEVNVARAEPISYYRLRQEDYDGSFENFLPISVSCGAEENWYVYANNNVLYINAENITASTRKLDILDMNGKNMFSKNITNGNSYYEALDLNMLSSGMYIIGISNNSEQKTFKIIVAR